MDTRILDFDDYLELLNAEELHEDIDFNDEIISIEEVEPVLMSDISVSNNHVFYGNDILIHNCATNNLEVDNSAISDSIATAMTADMICLILQNEEMKQKSEVTIKFTKNRYTGMTDTYMMNVDYPHMRFADMVVKIGDIGSDINISALSNDQKFIKTVTPNVSDDFGLITAEKIKIAEDFAKTEEVRISKDHQEAIKKADEKIKAVTPKKDSSNAFADSADDIFSQLGL